MQWNIKKKYCTEKDEKPNHENIIQTILHDRGVTSREQQERFRNPSYDAHLHDPFLFVDMMKIIDRLKKSQESQELVMIFGDFDCDGVTSSAVLSEVFTDFGINFQTYIPDKYTEGHGLSQSAVEKFYNSGVKLIVTVDCGVSNFDEVSWARKNNIDVIIIDHHHIPERLPDAMIINAQMEESGYPFRGICGVGTAFKVATALYKKYMPEKQEQLKWLLDLVAIGTVADCMPLKDENRALVKYGLIVLSKTRRLGLQEMFVVGKINIDEEHVPDAQKIAFHIAPRINAAGRIKHAKSALDLLIAKDQVIARDLALEIEARNQERRKISDYVTKQVRKSAIKDFHQKKLIFVSDPHFSFGVVGLVAGKIASEFNKPTAVLQNGDTETQGSFRSIPQINIIKVIEKFKNLLIKFGGHAQAAGISIKNENIEEFYTKLNIEIETQLEGKNIEPVCNIDCEITSKEISRELITALKSCEPFGQENPLPVFLVRDTKIVSCRYVGKGEKHIKIVISDGNNNYDVIGFGFGNKCDILTQGKKVEIAFHLEENCWNGNCKPQLHLVDIKLAKE